LNGLIDDTASGSPVTGDKKPARFRIAAFVANLFWSNSQLERGASSTQIAKITDGVIFISLICYAIFAPHSIALTQGAFLLGLVAWAIQTAASRSTGIRRSPVDVALLGFFACCVVSSFFSYDPMLSLKGLRSPAFFLAFYFVSSKIRSLRFATALAFIIIASCLVNVAYSGLQIARGKGLHIDAIKENSFLADDGLAVGDIILSADGQNVKSQEDLLRIIGSQRGRLRITYQRGEEVQSVNVSREYHGPEDDPLGISTSPGRGFRVSGFYSHYETYAEVLQLIGALALGMLIAHPRKNSATALFLAGSALLIAAALLLTSTRAAIVGLVTAAVIMAIASFRHRAIVIAALGVLVLMPAGLAVIEKYRGVSLFDLEEGSTAYRIEVWREAFRLVKDHPILGIGKGSEARLKEEFGLYDEGRLPPGHFHSTPVQIATWWGLPALVLYFATMAILGAESWKMARSGRNERNWRMFGLSLGSLGAIVAFNVSSLVHFNFGDGEVVMSFWLLAGIGFALHHMKREAPSEIDISQRPAREPSGMSLSSPLREQEEASELSARAARAKQN
jgi:hypothetical protein